MGIVLYQLLAQEFFKDFYVVAGHKGLSREVQGVDRKSTRLNSSHT